MFEGMYVEKVLTQKYIRPYPQQPQETSGYNIGSQAIYRYSLKDSDYPFMHLLYSQLLVCQRVCLQNTVCLICK